MFPVGFCELKITHVHPLLTILFKNVLRTFEAGILKIFKNIQSQPKNQTFLEKKKECSHLFITSLSTTQIIYQLFSYC